jgi:hypothetical protein
MTLTGDPLYDAESNLYWALVSECYRVSHLTPAAGVEIGRLCWESSGIVHFVPATTTGDPGRLTCPRFPRRGRVVNTALSKQIVEGLIHAAKRSCGDDWEDYVADYLGVSYTGGGGVTPANV